MSLVKSSLENQSYYNLESIFRAFKRKEMKASRRMAENDIITRGGTVKIQQVAVRGNYENLIATLGYRRWGCLFTLSFLCVFFR
jgi:hypothetical protein